MTGIQASQGAPVTSVLLAARRRAAIMTEDLVGGGPASGEEPPTRGAESERPEDHGVQFRWDQRQGILSVQHRETGRTLYQVKVQRGDAGADEIGSAFGNRVDTTI